MLWSVKTDPNLNFYLFVSLRISFLFLLCVFFVSFFFFCASFGPQREIYVIYFTVRLVLQNLYNLFKI